MFKSTQRSLILTCLALVSFCAMARGQAVFGNITGNVTDPAGAVIPGAEISIVDIDRGVTYKATANGSGNFTQTHLLPGKYEVRISSKGFAQYIANAEVQVDSYTRVDASLRIGEASSSVTVTGESPLLKTDRADVSNTLTSSELGQLPIVDRNITSLLVALPGGGLYAGNSGVASAENQQRFQALTSGARA